MWCCWHNESTTGSSAFSPSSSSSSSSLTSCYSSCFLLQRCLQRSVILLPIMPTTRSHCNVFVRSLDLLLGTHTQQQGSSFSSWMQHSTSMHESIWRGMGVARARLGRKGHTKSRSRKDMEDHIINLKVLNFWKLTSYCSLKPLWSGMGEAVPARTSPTLHPPFPPTVLKLSVTILAL